MWRGVSKFDVSFSFVILIHKFANASDGIRQEAIKQLSRRHMANHLYLPAGNFYGMNGNYAAGLLEGLAHYIPETGELIAGAVEKVGTSPADRTDF